MIGYAIVLAILAALVDYFFGIAEPWRKIIFAGIVVLFVIGVIMLLAPGLFSGLGRV
jgi:membrane protein YdbS with pleckstrin-like domain